MTLTENEKDYLISLSKHPWMAVVKKIEEDALNQLWQLFSKSDLDNSEHIAILKKNQIYVTARKDFLLNIDKHTRVLYAPKV